MATKLKDIKLSHSALCVVAVLINQQQKRRVSVHGIQKISGNMLFHFLHISNLKNVQIELWQKLRHDEVRRIQNEAITLHLPSVPSCSLYYSSPSSLTSYPDLFLYLLLLSSHCSSFLSLAQLRSLHSHILLVLLFISFSLLTFPCFCVPTFFSLLFRYFFPLSFLSHLLCLSLLIF